MTPFLVPAWAFGLLCLAALGWVFLGVVYLVFAAVERKLEDEK